jgi:hypothetical protein
MGNDALERRLAQAGTISGDLADEVASEFAKYQHERSRDNTDEPTVLERRLARTRDVDAELAQALKSELRKFQELVRKAEAFTRRVSQTAADHQAKIKTTKLLQKLFDSIRALDDGTEFRFKPPAGNMQDFEDFMESFVFTIEENGIQRFTFKTVLQGVLKSFRLFRAHFASIEAGIHQYKPNTYFFPSKAVHKALSLNEIGRALEQLTYQIRNIHIDAVVTPEKLEKTQDLIEALAELLAALIPDLRITVTALVPMRSSNRQQRYDANTRFLTMVIAQLRHTFTVRRRIPDTPPANQSYWNALSTLTQASKRFAYYASLLGATKP